MSFPSFSFLFVTHGDGITDLELIILGALVFFFSLSLPWYNYKLSFVFSSFCCILMELQDFSVKVKNANCLTSGFWATSKDEMRFANEQQ